MLLLTDHLDLLALLLLPLLLVASGLLAC